MNDFKLFFTIGLQHILDLKGIDHILFIAALTLRYLPMDWKKILVLITAFTLGHSLTLALSTLNIVNLPTAFTEFLIALTIFITAINNFSVKSFNFSKKYPLLYFYAILFGLIHGLGFSTLLKSMLGISQNITAPLLAFNLGLEAGQVIIVAMLLLAAAIFVTKLHISRRAYVIGLSSAVAAAAVVMMIERIPHP